MSLETALLSMLQVHAGHPDNSPLAGDELRRRLGYEQTSGNSVRLLVGLQLYGLLQRSEKEYLLTRAALHLLETADERAFRAGLQRAAALPPLLRELTGRYGTDLDGHELREDLKGRRLPESERRTLTKVLRDNQDLLGQGAHVATLFEQFGKHSPFPQAASPVSAGQWLRTLPGRTANLTLAAVVFVVSLVGAALLPGTQKPATQAQAARPSAQAGRQVSPPVAVVSVPLATTTPAAPTEPNVQANSRGGSSQNLQTTETASAGTATASNRSVGTFSDVQPTTRARAPLSSSAASPDSPTRPAVIAAASQARTAARPRPQATSTPSTSSEASERAQIPPTRTTPSSEARTRPVHAEPAQAPTSRRSVTAMAAAQVQTTEQHVPTRGTRSTATVVSSSSTARDALNPNPLEVGRRLADLLYSQRLTLLWKTFSPGVQQEWGSFAAFRDYRLGGLDAYGAETRVVSEEVRTSGGVTYYVRTATFERGPDHDWTLILGLNTSGQVVEFNIVKAGILPGVMASAEH